MKNIEIHDQDFERLQAFAVPLVDSTASAFSKILDLAEKMDNSRSEVPAAKNATAAANIFGATEVPPLRHTKVLAGSFGGVEIEKTTWDALVRAALAALWKEHGDCKLLKGCSGANLVEGVKTDEGYKFLPEFGFSYQGVSADDAIEIAIRAARSLNTSIIVDFVWREKKDAHLPGARARIEI